MLGVSGPSEDSASVSFVSSSTILSIFSDELKPRNLRSCAMVARLRLTIAVTAMNVSARARRISTSSLLSFSPALARAASTCFMSTSTCSVLAMPSVYRSERSLKRATSRWLTTVNHSSAAVSRGVRHGSERGLRQR